MLRELPLLQAIFGKAFLFVLKVHEDEFLQDRQVRVHATRIEDLQYPLECKVCVTALNSRQANRTRGPALVASGNGRDKCIMRDRCALLLTGDAGADSEAGSWRACASPQAEAWVPSLHSCTQHGTCLAGSTCSPYSRQQWRQWPRRPATIERSNTAVLVGR